MTIHAYTEMAYEGYPAYVNLSGHPADPNKVVLTVRGRNESRTSAIDLDRDQLHALINDAANYLFGTATITMTVADPSEIGSAVGGVPYGGYVVAEGNQQYAHPFLQPRSIG